MVDLQFGELEVAQAYFLRGFSSRVRDGTAALAQVYASELHLLHELVVNGRLVGSFDVL